MTFGIYGIRKQSILSESVELSDFVIQFETPVETMVLIEVISQYWRSVSIYE